MPILIVDDDPQIRTVLGIALERAGHQVRNAADGMAALREAQRQPPDLIVLDVGLPELDGLQVCARLRALPGPLSRVPILFLSARDDEVDRILGLEMGGDDYVTKPFSPRELVARVRAILARARPQVQPTLGHGGLEVDPARHLCRARGTEVALTATEMDLLVHLIARPDQVHPRPALVDAVWGTAAGVSDRTLDSHLRNLRRKLALAGLPDALDTLHGLGIRMGPCRGD